MESSNIQKPSMIELKTSLNQVIELMTEETINKDRLCVLYEYTLKMKRSFTNLDSLSEEELFIFYMFKYINSNLLLEINEDLRDVDRGSIKKSLLRAFIALDSQNSSSYLRHLILVLVESPNANDSSKTWGYMRKLINGTIRIQQLSLKEDFKDIYDDLVKLLDNKYILSLFLAANNCHMEAGEKRHTLLKTASHVRKMIRIILNKGKIFSASQIRDDDDAETTFNTDIYVDENLFARYVYFDKFDQTRKEKGKNRIILTLLHELMQCKRIIWGKNNFFKSTPPKYKEMVDWMEEEIRNNKEFSYLTDADKTESRVNREIFTKMYETDEDNTSNLSTSTISDDAGMEASYPKTYRCTLTRKRLEKEDPIHLLRLKMEEDEISTY